MGAAKQRGTFEQRQAAAYKRIDAGIEVQKREIEELEAFEQRQKDAMANYLTTYIIPGMEKKHGALMRSDFTLIPLSVTNAAVETN